jgi:hypothetical protein
MGDVPIDELRLSPLSLRATSRRRQPRHRAYPFLKGPIPLSWLTSAAQQRGHALHVGLALWYLVGVSKSMTVNLRPTVLRSFGVSRFAGYRALDVLVHAGLVEVKRHRGRSPVVTVVVVDENQGCEDDPQNGCVGDGTPS